MTIEYDRNLVDEYGSSSLDIALWDTNKNVIYLSWKNNPGTVYSYIMDDLAALDFFDDLKEEGSLGAVVNRQRRNWDFNGFVHNATYEKRRAFAEQLTSVTDPYSLAWQDDENSTTSHEVLIEFRGTLRLTVEGATNVSEAVEKAESLLATSVVDGKWSAVEVKKVN